MSLHSYFDSNGQQLGALFDVTAPAPAPQTQLNTAGTVAAAISQAALDYLRTREQRRLEQSYLRAGMTAPGSMLAPQQQTPGQAYSAAVSQAAGNISIPWPLLLLVGGAVLLIKRKN